MWQPSSVLCRQRAVVSADLWPPTTRLGAQRIAAARGSRGRGTAHEVGTPTPIVGGLMPLNRESNGTSFSSNDLLSIADLEEKEKVSALVIMMVCVGGVTGDAFTICGWGPQPLISVSGWESLFMRGCPGTRDNQVLRMWAGAPRAAREGAVNGPYVAGRAHFSPLTGEMGGRTGQR